MNSMNQDFKTTEMRIVVENRTYSGSGFGTTDDGEGVFMSQRLFDSMGLCEGDIVTAHCIPNFADKRDQIPWRAIRVERDVEPAPEPEPVAPERRAEDTDAEVYAEISGSMDPWSTRELSETVGLDPKTVGNSCMRLFNRGKIAKAEVYAGPGQERASFLLWGYGVESFK